MSTPLFPIPVLFGKKRIKSNKFNLAETQSIFMSASLSLFLSAMHGDGFA